MSPPMDPAVKHKISIGLVFLYGLLMCACSGTVYLYSTYAGQFKKRLHYTQYDMNVVALVGENLSSFGGMLTSYCVDQYGPSGVSLASGVISFAGFFLMREVYEGRILCSPFVLGLFFMLSNISSSGGYQVALATNLGNFGPSFRLRGVMTGVLVGGYGLTAFIFSAFFVAFWSPDGIAQFFLFLALTTAVIYCLGALAIRRLTPLTGPLQPPAAGEMTGLLEAERGQPVNASPGPTALLPVPARKLNFTVVETLKTLEFWLLYFAMMGPIACGLMVMNNLSAIMTTIAGPGVSESDLSARTAAQVSLISIFNCIGRVVCGVLADVANRRGSPRSVILAACSLLMVGTQAVAAFAPLTLNSVFVLTASVGFAYGGVYSTAPVTVADLFGTVAFALIWAIAITSGGIGSTIVNLMFGKLYDEHNGNYKVAFEISLMFAGAGFLCALLLIVRQRVIVRVPVAPVK